MKKIKGERSMTHKVKQSKPTNQNKTHIASKKNHIPKKQAESHKENKSMLIDGPIFVKPPKKANIRSKQRSKSLVFDRKLNNATAQSSSRYALMQILQKKIDKADTDISAHLNSVKNDKHMYDIQKIYSNYLSPHKHQYVLDSFSVQNKYQSETTPKLKLLQEENQTLRTNLSAMKQEIYTYLHQNKVAKQQNEALKFKITEFQYEAETQISNLKQKEQQMRANHRAQKEHLENKVNHLQNQQDRLLKQKEQLQSLVKNQQENILILQQERTQLQTQCQLQKQQKAFLKKDKEEAAIRILSLEQQLQLFQTNLKEFEQIKETYEEKLVLLERQKQRIKKNAFQLLQMVQSYRDG